MLLVAAGGIADGRSAAAAPALGSDGVWVGTRLLASVESVAHSEYKRRVLAAGVDDTVRHNVFGPEFPDATVRGLRNRVVKEWEGRDYPKVPMTRFCGFPPTEKASGDFEEMSWLAGESVGQTNELLGVEEIVTTMMSDAATIIRKRLGTMVADR